MRRNSLYLCFAAVLAAVPVAASAQSRAAYAIDGAEIYAGPGQDYPVVAELGPGVGVRVQGCLNDYSWCDVTFGPNRGWVYGGELGYAYQNRRVPILEYGPRLALPVIAFSFGNYWDRYYRGRSWYGQRNVYQQRWNDDRGRGDNGWHGRDYRGEGWRDRDRGGDRGRGNNVRIENDNHGGYRVGGNPGRVENNNRGNNPVRVENDNRGDRGRGNPGRVENENRGGDRGQVDRNRPAGSGKFDNGADHQQ